MFIAGLLTFSLSLAIFVYVKYKAPKRPCIRLNFRRNPAAKNFQRLGHGHGNDADDETHGAAFDELNGFEYDDEFEIQHPPSTTTASSLGENLEEEAASDYPHQQPKSVYGGSRFGRMTSRSLQHIRRLKTSLLSKDGLLNVTNLNHPLYNRQHQSRQFPHYSYNSTASTLVPTNLASNEFVKSAEESLERVENGDSLELASVVTYDIGKKKSRQNVVKNSYHLLVANTSHGNNNTDPESSGGANAIRLAENPLDALDLSEAKDKASETTA